jgi:hypothetical protein
MHTRRGETDTEAQYASGSQQTLPHPADELEQWVQACQGGSSSDASFEQVYPFSEAILIGNIALRIPGELRWDAARDQVHRRPRGRRTDDPRVSRGLGALIRKRSADSSRARVF